MSKGSVSEKESPGRTIVMSSDVDQLSVGLIMERICEINDIDDENEATVVDYERKPIKLIVNSYGGDVYDGFGLIGVIESSKTQVHTYCYGSAMSMGLVILASGHERYMHGLSSCMYHEVSSGFHHEALTTIVENVEELRRIQDMYDSFLIRKTGLKKRQLDEVKRNKKDWFFGADEAHKFKVVDYII